MSSKLNKVKMVINTTAETRQFVERLAREGGVPLRNLAGTFMRAGVNHYLETMKQKQQEENNGTNVPGEEKE